MRRDAAWVIHALNPLPGDPVVKRFVANVVGVLGIVQRSFYKPRRLFLACGGLIASHVLAHGLRLEALSQSRKTNKLRGASSAVQTLANFVHCFQADSARCGVAFGAKFASEGESRFEIARNESSVGRASGFQSLENQSLIFFVVPSVVRDLIFQCSECLRVNVFRLMLNQLGQVLCSA